MSRFSVTLACAGSLWICCQSDLSCATLVHTLPGDVLEHRGSLVRNDGMDRVPLLTGTEYRRS